MERMEHEPEFGATLRRLRLAADLTQEALGEAVGCAAETVRAFESGRRRPSREMAQRIAAALQLAHEEHDAFVRRARSQPAQVSRIVPPRPAISNERLPPQPPRDALIGRADLLARVRQALLDEQHAVVTLLGPGGIGKTRLALHIAAELHGDFADGVSFVALASATTVEEVVTAIAAALGHTLPAGMDLEELLVAFLRDRALLLVLDNLEQLLVAPQRERLGQLVARLVRDAPDVRILVTSRERLRLRVEWVIEVAGLSLPDEGQADSVERSDAVLLFLERARQLSDSFAITPDNRAAIARICRLLGGVPLAIELAAAWTYILSCDEIADEVARSLDFLAVEEHDRPSRHRSLRAVIEHSWRLLSPSEQHTLMRLSVFRGGCRRETLAEVLAGEADDARLPTAQLTVLRGVATLVDKSLAWREQSRGGETRYTLHDLVHQYAAEALRADPEEHWRTHNRHCSAYVELLRRHEQELWGADQHAALATLTDEIDNIRAAWQWALAQRDADRMLPMLDSLWRFYEGRGWFQEAAATFATSSAIWEAAAAPTSSDPTFAVARGALLALHGWFEYRVGRLADAQDMLAKAVALLRPTRRSRWLAHALNFLSVVQLYAGEYAEARTTCEASAALYQRIGHEWGWAYCCGTLGAIAAAQGDSAIAMAQWRTALTAYRALGDTRLQAISLIFLGAALVSVGDETEAEHQLSEALALSRALDDPLTMAFALLELGTLYTRLGRLVVAETQLTESLARLQGLGERNRATLALAQLGNIALARGALELAQQRYGESFAAAAAAQSLPGMLGALGGFAGLLAERQAPVEALQLATVVLEHPAATAEIKTRMERLRASIRPRLSAQERAASAAQLGVEIHRLGESGELPAWLHSLLQRVSTPRCSDQLPPSPPNGLPVEATGETLSPREVEVLRLLMGGLSNRQIADALIISPHTVKHHVASVFQKLAVTSRTQAVTHGTALGLSPLTVLP
jgi:predicted ATPase/DNA-binding CsgD family transcriptional regulator/DNA-binding XRE family transcriptional regulator